jgi:hypothetical protein
VDLFGHQSARRGAAEIAMARQLPHQFGAVRGETRPLRRLPPRLHIRAAQLGVEALERIASSTS